jgi:small-conductance mechanosensitive channel
MDIQQAIDLRIPRQFARLGIEFAYPTQRILFTPLNGGMSAPD